MQLAHHTILAMTGLNVSISRDVFMVSAATSLATLDRRVKVVDAIPQDIYI